MKNLLSDDISSLSGVLALVDDVTDLLITKQEVDTVCGQSQERVVGMLDLQEKTGEFSDISAVESTVTLVYKPCEIPCKIWMWHHQSRYEV